MREHLLHDVVAVAHRGGHRLYLRFDDGVEGEVDLRELLGKFTGVFSPLAEAAYTSRVRVDPDLGTISWPNGADIAPETLYCAVKGTPVPACEGRRPVRVVQEARPVPRRRRTTASRGRGKSRRHTGR